MASAGVPLNSELRVGRAETRRQTDALRSSHIRMGSVCNWESGCYEIDMRRHSMASTGLG